MTVTEKQEPERTAMWLAKQGITVCSDCGLEKPTEDCVAVRKQFQTIGESPKTLKSATLKKVCSECLLNDPDWESDPRWFK